MNFQKKILIIEDDQNLGDMIQQILVFHKYDVCFAGNGAAGIQKAFEYSPDLILCDINMEPPNGYQVYKVLEESSILNRIPFIFLTGSSELEDIRFGMSLGADDYIVKPFRNDDLIKTIEKRLEKFKAIREDSNKEFNRLFDLSPAGIFIFDGQKIFRTNPAFRTLLQLGNEDPAGRSLSEFIDPQSIAKLRGKISGYLTNRSEIYNDTVGLKNNGKESTPMKLVVSEFEKFSKYTLFIGLLSSAAEPTITANESHYVKDIYSLLKRENIKISETLGEEITNIFKQKNLNIKNQTNSFFTKRESQVLYLSMEGLPIKTIADRLEISDRTVEKHRTRLMEKSGANNMIEVIIFALRNSLVEI
ncbi:MAG: response regulator [Prolixibacteraceae bacterium]|nr:response regulator [Prolixibacteraceae bacterium]